MGLFGRARDLVGLDIGSHSIKLVELRQKGKSFELSSFGIQPLPPEAIVEGAIMDSSAVAEAIELLKGCQKISLVLNKVNPSMLVENYGAYYGEQYKVPKLGRSSIPERISSYVGNYLSRWYRPR